MNEPYYIVPDKCQLLKAVTTLRKQLDGYDGEVIMKGEHPLHCCVVAVEKMCNIVRWEDNEDAAKTVMKMPAPIGNVWYYMLWACRGKTLVQPGQRSAVAERPSPPRPDKELALFWKDKLAQGLGVMAECIEDGSYHQALTCFPEEPEETDDDDFDITETQRKRHTVRYEYRMQKEQVRDLLESFLGHDWLRSENYR